MSIMTAAGHLLGGPGDACHPGQGQRHLAVHIGHCVELNAADEACWRAGGSSTLRDVTLSGTRDQVRRTLENYRARGVTEVVFRHRHRPARLRRPDWSR